MLLSHLITPKRMLFHAKIEQHNEPTSDIKDTVETFMKDPFCMY
jgi:hypothetical protein